MPVKITKKGYSIEFDGDDITIVTKDHTVKCKAGADVKALVFEKLLDWYAKHDVFEGEVIMQDDDAQIYSPIVLSEIADKLIKFKHE